MTKQMKILNIRASDMKKVAKRNSVVLFYKPNCPKCQKFQPKYSQLMNYDLDYRKIDLFRINVHTHKNNLQEFLNLHNINSFPSIVLFKQGKNSMPTVVRNVKALRKIRSEIARKYNLAGNNIQDRILNQIRKKQQVTYDLDDEGMFDDTGVLVVENMRTPGSGFKNIQQILNGPTAVLFHRPTCPHCVNFMPIYENVSRKAPGNMRIMSINMDKHGKQAMKFLQKNRGKPNSSSGWLPLSGVPTVYIVNSNTDDVKVMQVTRNNMTEGGILDIMKQMFSKRRFNDHVVEQLTGRLLTDIQPNKRTQHTLSETVASDAIVMFYAPWCGACKRAIPLMHKLAEQMDKQRKAGQQAVEVMIVDHHNNRETVDRFINNFNEISLLNTSDIKPGSLLEVKEYPTVWIFRSQQPRRPIRVSSSTSKNAPPEHKYISLSLMRHYATQAFQGLNLNRDDLFNANLSPLWGGDDTQPTVVNTNSKFVSLVDGEHDKSTSKVSLFSIAGGEEDIASNVSLFSIAGGKKDITSKVSLFSIVDDEHIDSSVSSHSDSDHLEGGYTTPELVHNTSIIAPVSEIANQCVLSGGTQFGFDIMQHMDRLQKMDYSSLQNLLTVTKASSTSSDPRPYDYVAAHTLKNMSPTLSAGNDMNTLLSEVFIANSTDNYFDMSIIDRGSDGWGTTIQKTPYNWLQKCTNDHQVTEKSAMYNHKLWFDTNQVNQIFGVNGVNNATHLRAFLNDTFPDGKFGQWVSADNSDNLNAELQVLACTAIAALHTAKNNHNGDEDIQQKFQNTANVLFNNLRHHGMVGHIKLITTLYKLK